MSTPKRKAARLCKNRTAIDNNTRTKNNMNATDFIAACLCQASAKCSFGFKAGAGIGKAKKGAGKARATFHAGARHTMYNAGNLSDNEVFSRPEFKDGPKFRRIYGFGAGSAYPQGRQHGVVHVSIPSSTFWPRQPDGGFQSHNGAEAMTKVNTLTTPKTGNTSPLARQQAIENALSTALYFIRLPSTESGLKAATGRAIRAASMLKQACAEIQNGGAA